MLAPTPIRQILNSAERWPTNQRVKVAGTVTLTLYAGTVLFLQDATGAIGAGGRANSQVQLGDLVEAVGTLRRTGYSSTLANCSFRSLGKGPPVHPRHASGVQLKSGALDMELVRVEGPLLRDPILRADAGVLEMKVDHAFVTLLVTDPAGSPLSELHPGSLLQATGVCSIGPDAQGRPAWIRIYLPSDDVKLLRGPPWWTPERTSAVLGFVALSGLAGMAWLAMLRHRGLTRALDSRVKEATADLRARTAELERLNRDLQAFSYSVSHDLRAPLRAMAGFSQALAEDYAGTLDETGQEYLRRIRDAAAKMNRLIDGLLSLARVTRSELHRQTTDLSEIATAVAEELRQLYPGLQVNITIEPDMVDSVDRNLIRTVFDNLLQNAWKFCCKTPEPKIEVGRLAAGASSVYYVRDNGVGFDPNQAARLFEPFLRLHSPAEYEGTGIGLAIAQKVVERHGGRIWAEGKLNEGACFFFTLHPETERKGLA